MIVLVIGVNFVFWRPVTAWAERFRVEESEAAERPRSLVLDVLRRSQVPEQLGRPLRPVGRLLDRATRPFGLAEHPLTVSRTRERTGDVFFAGVLAVLVAYGAWEALGYVRATTGLGEFGYAFALGAATFARVIVLLAVATVVWVPIGVWIGMNPKVTRFAQPIVQVLASFPANFLFPFATVLFVAWHIPLNFGGILLMALGAQWYILFNVIAGASAIPSDLREAMTNLQVRGWLRWKHLSCPPIFASLRHRRDHRRGRRVERLHRRRDRQLRPPSPDRHRPRRLHRRGDRDGELPEDPGRHRGDERLRGRSPTGCSGAGCTL